MSYCNAYITAIIVFHNLMLKICHNSLVQTSNLRACVVIATLCLHKHLPPGPPGALTVFLTQIYPDTE